MLGVVASVVASALFYFLQPPLHRSEAKLLVRYVVDASGAERPGAGRQLRVPEQHGNNLIHSELEILTSLDLCQQVVSEIGSAKILGRSEATNQLPAATAMLRHGLAVEVPKDSSVLRVTLRHRDPAVAHLALGKLLEAYLRRHLEVHRAIGAEDKVLHQQADYFRARFVETEARLRRLKTNITAVSVEEERRMLNEQYARTRQELFTAQAQLAESAAGTSDSEKQRHAALQAKIAVVTLQSKLVKAELTALSDIEDEVHRLQRLKEVEEQNYRYCAAGIEQARFEEAMVRGNAGSISVIQAPGPPLRDRRFNILIGILAAGILGSLVATCLRCGSGSQENAA